MRHTFSSHIITELKSSGFEIVKCPIEREWQLLDKSSNKAEILMRSVSLGELSRKAAKEFGLSWK